MIEANQLLESEIQNWQAIMDKDLSETEEEDICFSPAEEIIVDTSPGGMYTQKCSFYIGKLVGTKRARLSARIAKYLYSK